MSQALSPDLPYYVSLLALSPPARAFRLSRMDTEDLLDLLREGSSETVLDEDEGSIDSSICWPAATESAAASPTFAFSLTSTAPFSIWDSDNSCQFMIDTVPGDADIAPNTAGMSAFPRSSR